MICIFQMENRGALCDSIIRYNVLQKRKVYLDSIGQGLEEFGILSAIKYFPDLFASMFIPSSALKASDVLEVMSFPRKMAKEEQVVAGFIKECIQQLSRNGQSTLAIAILNFGHGDLSK